MNISLSVQYCALPLFVVRAKKMKIEVNIGNLKSAMALTKSDSESELQNSIRKTRIMKYLSITDSYPGGSGIEACGL